MALRVEIWGLQLIEPFARIWQRRSRVLGARAQSAGQLAPHAANEGTVASTRPDDLGVWVGAVRLRDLPVPGLSANDSSPSLRTAERVRSTDRRVNNVVYLPSRSQAGDAVARGNEVRRIFEQNRIDPSFCNRMRSVSPLETPRSMQVRA